MHSVNEIAKRTSNQIEIGLDGLVGWYVAVAIWTLLVDTSQSEERIVTRYYS